MENSSTLNLRCSTCHNALSATCFDIQKTGEYLRTCRARLAEKARTKKSRPVIREDIEIIRQQIIILISSVNKEDILAQVLEFTLKSIPNENQLKKSLHP